jgi:hypothetical protein
MNRIVNIRGTSGSGKTTVARTLLISHPHRVLKGADGKIKGYQIDASSSGIHTPVFLVGSYAYTCGGVDGIKTQEEIADRVVKAVEYGHVLVEGLLMSKSGPSGHVSPIFRDHNAVFAFLDTPLDVCIERVLGRRKAAGNNKPFDPDKSLSVAHKQCARCAQLLIDAGGYDVRWVSWQDPVTAVVDYLTEAES